MCEYKKIYYFKYIINIHTYRMQNTKDINYNSDIKVNGPSLKISLIQTAYEIYTTNIENLSNNSTYEDLYNNTSRDAKKHYKWLTKTYNSMDDDMKFKLKNIFDSNSSWSYINSVINLDDKANVSDISGYSSFSVKI